MEEHTPDEEDNDGSRWEVILGAVAASLIAALVGAFAWNRKRRKRREEELERANEYELLERLDLETGLLPAVDKPRAISPAVAPPPPRFGRVAGIDVVAPAGELGILADTSVAGEHVRGCAVEDSSPLIGLIESEDAIIAVDGEDVRGLAGIDVHELLKGKDDRKRRITVLREVDGFDGSGRDDSGLPTGAQSSTIVEIVAPPGKLGAADSAPECGPALVTGVDERSPLWGWIRKGDAIVAVDGEDARDWNAATVSEFLAGRSANAERTISVLREGGDDAADDGPPREEAAGIDIVAPAGLLGITAASRPGEGPALVDETEEDSQIADEMRPGDEIVAVDGRDVSRMSADAVSRECPVAMNCRFVLFPSRVACSHLFHRVIAFGQPSFFARSKVLLASKSDRTERKITVRREGSLSATAGGAPPALSNARNVSEHDAQSFHR